VYEATEKSTKMLVTQNKKIETNNFIESVKKFPEIFDTTHPGFKQQDDKSGAWEKIAQEFQTDCKFRNTLAQLIMQPSRISLIPSNVNFSKFMQKEVPDAPRALHTGVEKKLPRAQHAHQIRIL
jgi:hypothetical protein